MPRLKISAADAPASSAFCALTAKSQVPRWISAMSPSGKPVKSSGSQPLSEVSLGVKSVSTTVTGAVTSPEPEYSMIEKSSPSTYGVGVGLVCSSVVGVSSLKAMKSNSSTRGL